MDNNEIFGGENEKYNIWQVIAGSIMLFVVIGAVVLFTLTVLEYNRNNYQLEDTGEVYK